jgi:hypothetical protein
VYIVELTTTAGPVCERFATYEEARRRVEWFPAEALLGIPFIFEELPDGSQRLVREDGKPLQWHRLPEDPLPAPDEPLPLCEDPAGILGERRPERPPEPEEGEWGDDVPLWEGPPL